MWRKLLLSVGLGFVLLFASKPVLAADPTPYQCAGTALAAYMNAVIDAKKASGWKHIRLLSPAFNIGAGDGSFLALYNGMKAADAHFFDLDGIAVNAYNVDGHTIMEYVNKGISDAGLVGRAVYITEMGMLEIDRNGVSRTDALQHLKDQIAVIKATSTIPAALIFNAFGGNPQFTYDTMSDADLQFVCGGDCGKIGVNSAKTYTSGSGFYDRAGRLGMKYSLEIATTNYGDVVTGVQQAESNGITPIIRIGTTSGSGGFDDVSKYVDLLSQVDKAASGDVFAIAGPNEPNAEQWVAPQCHLPGSGDQGAVQPPARNPIAEGFTAFEYPCNETTGNKPEFDPSRPYPGSPCDPLIPQSWPEKDYVSFACGKSINVQNDVTLSRDYPVGDLPPNPIPGTAYWCDGSHTQACVIKKFDYNVNIDLSPASIPIVGNTQDHLSDAAKVNQYLLSYLGGTVQQAEQKPLDPTDSSAIARMINFAGPLKKLLSFDSQIKLKSDLITGHELQFSYHDYVVGCNQVLDINPNDYKSALDHILGSLNDSLLILAKFALLIGPDIAHNIQVEGDAVNAVAQQCLQKTLDCSNPSILEASLFNELNKAGLKQDVLNQLLDIAKLIFRSGPALAESVGATMASIKQVAPNQAVACLNANVLTNQIRLSTFKSGNNLPPVQQPGESYSDYWNKYLAWHGSTILPVVGAINPLNITSVWASLFQNVPFSTLEDTVGEYTISVVNKAGQQPEGVITGDANMPITLTISSGDSRLIVPHVKALNALSQLLQKIIMPMPDNGPIGYKQTQIIEEHQVAYKKDAPPSQQFNVVSAPFYCIPWIKLIYNSPLCNNSSVVPKGAAHDLLGLGPDGAAPPPLFETDSTCDLKDVRINSGDNVYGKSVSAKLSYYQKFTYAPNKASGACVQNGDNCTFNEDCCSGQCNFRVDSDHPAAGKYCAGSDLKTKTEARVAVFDKIPLMDQIYEKLVVGPNGVLRRFLQAQGCVPNCTDQQKHSYFREGGSAIPAAMNAAYSGDGTVTAGDKSGGGQIYVPRLGSLFDYILGSANENMNLQKMLRPKGIGGGGTTGLVSNPPGSCIPPASGLCSLNDPQTQLLNNFGPQANTAAMICERESRGNALALNTSCLPGSITHTADYSVGLFQINLLSHPGPAFLDIPEGSSLKLAIAAAGFPGKTCYEAFSNWQDYKDPANYGEDCKVINQKLLDTCVQWFQNPANSVAYAKNMSGGGADWSPWSTYNGITQCHQ